MQEIAWRLQFSVFIMGSKWSSYTYFKDILIPNCSDAKTLHQPRYKKAHLTELCGHLTQRYIEHLTSIQFDGASSLCFTSVISLH